MATSHLRDTTILVVLYLTIHAHLVNDIVSAKSYSQGVRKLTELEGVIYAPASVHIVSFEADYRINKVSRSR